MKKNFDELKSDIERAGTTLNLNLNDYGTRIQAYSRFFPNSSLKLSNAEIPQPIGKELIVTGIGDSAGPFPGLEVTAVFLSDLTMTCEGKLSNLTDNLNKFSALKDAVRLLSALGLNGGRLSLGFLPQPSPAPTLDFSVVISPYSDELAMARLNIGTRIQFAGQSIKLAVEIIDPNEDLFFIAETEPVQAKLDCVKELLDISGELKDVTRLADLVGENNLQNITGSIKLTRLIGKVSPTDAKVRFVSATVEPAKPVEWTLLKKDNGTDLLSVGKPALHFTARFPDGPAQYEAAFSGEMTIGTSGKLEIYSSFPAGCIGVSLQENSQLKIKDIFLLFAGGSHPLEPSFPSGDLTEFRAFFTAKGHISGHAELEGDWKIFETLTLKSVGASLEREEKTARVQNPVTTLQFSARLEINQTTQIDLVADYDSSGWAFTGMVTTSIGFSEAVAALAAKLEITGVPTIPDSLDATLKTLSLYFHSDTRDLVLSAKTAGGTTVVAVIFGLKNGTKKFAFLIDKVLHFGLASLPLVGDKIAAAAGKIAKIEDVGIESLQAFITSGFNISGAEQPNPYLTLKNK